MRLREDSALLPSDLLQALERAITATASSRATRANALQTPDFSSQISMNAALSHRYVRALLGSPGLQSIMLERPGVDPYSEGNEASLLLQLSRVLAQPHDAVQQISEGGALRPLLLDLVERCRRADAIVNTD